LKFFQKKQSFSEEPSENLNPRFCPLREAGRILQHAGAGLIGLLEAQSPDACGKDQGTKLMTLME
jgi:hypothetical protein